MAQKEEIGLDCAQELELRRSERVSESLLLLKPGVILECFALKSAKSALNPTFAAKIKVRDYKGQNECPSSSFLVGLVWFGLRTRTTSQQTNQPPREQWWWNDDIRVEQRIKRKKGANCHLQRMNGRMALNFANISTTTTHGKRLLYRIIPFVKPDYRHPQRSVLLPRL